MKKKRFGFLGLVLLLFIITLNYPLLVIAQDSLDTPSQYGQPDENLTEQDIAMRHHQQLKKRHRRIKQRKAIMRSHSDNDNALENNLENTTSDPSNLK